MDANDALGASSPFPTLPAAQSQLQSTLAKEKAEMQPAVQQLNKTIDAPKPAVPEQKEAPKAPDAQQFGMDAQNYVIAISALSAVAGAFSRQHATTALNSFTGAINGYKQGNQQAFDNASKQWEEANKATIENNKMLTDKYEEVMKNRSLTEQEQMNKIQMIAFQYKDEMMAETKNIDLAAKILEIREQAAGRLQAAQQKVQEHKDMLDYMKVQKDTPTLDSAAIEKLADAVGKDGIKMGTLGLGVGMNANKVAVLNKIAEKYPNVDLANVEAGFIEKTQEARTVGSNAARINLASNSLDQAIPLMLEASKNVDREEYPDINAIENAVRRKTGDTNIIRLNTAIQQVAADFATLKARGGVSTEGTRAEAREAVNSAYTEGQLEAFADQVRKEAASQKAATKQTREELSGKSDNVPSSDNKTIHWDDLK